MSGRHFVLKERITIKCDKLFVDFLDFQSSVQCSIISTNVSRYKIIIIAYYYNSTNSQGSKGIRQWPIH